MNEKEKVKGVNFLRKNTKTIFKVIILVICLGFGAIYATYAVNDATAIGSDNALNYAYSDAGVDPVSATDVKVEFEFRGGQFVYDIEFTSGGVEYEYYVKASNGDIVKKETEIITTSETTTITSNVTLSDAKSIALNDAGIDESDITFTKTELDYDDGVQVYDIEFYSSNTEYEYEINAETGKIYSKSTEKKTSSSSSSSSSTSGSSTSTSSDIITLAKAKSIALSDAGVTSSNVTYTKAELDYDDGVQVYDIEFYTSSTEYEYEINAKTGTIIEKSSEAFKTSSSSSSSSSYIGLTKAKEIATTKAGLSTSSVTFSKSKLESDDGIMFYEIEFYYNGVEYECTINATTGSIIEYDYDRD